MSMLKFFRLPFAVSGDKTAVPDASQPSGSVSYEDGFGVDYELDPGVDPAAKDVPRDETNQLFYDITNAIKEYQEFGTPDFITAALNGGVAFSYSKWARVKYSDGFIYVSKIDTNTDLPTVAASWFKLTEDAGFLTIPDAVFEASVANGEAVYWDSANNRFDEAVADGTTKQNVIGFADVTNLRVFVAGLYAGQLAGLAGNTAYYLSTVTPGALTSAKPATNVVRVGTAKNATDMYVAIFEAPSVTQAALQGAIRNLKGSAPGNSAIVTYTADEIVTGDGAGNYLSTRTWNSTINMAAAGAGGLDTGAVAASTWYYAYAITKDDGTKALIASLSSANPTLPATYTKWARIGSFRTDATANKYPLNFIQADRRIQYKVAAATNVAAYPQMAAQATGLPSSWTAVSISNYVPPTAVAIRGFGSSILTTNSGNISIAPNNQTTPGTAPSYANPMPRHIDGNNTSVSLGYDFLIESTNIYWCGPGIGTSSNVLACEGYDDNF